MIYNTRNRCGDTYKRWHNSRFTFLNKPSFCISRLADRSISSPPTTAINTDESRDWNVIRERKFICNTNLIPWVASRSNESNLIRHRDRTVSQGNYTCMVERTRFLSSRRWCGEINHGITPSKFHIEYECGNFERNLVFRTNIFPRSYLSILLARALSRAHTLCFSSL